MAETLLFLDTESDIVTKDPLSIQWATETDSGVITDFTPESYAFIRNLWYQAEAVIMFNAPYDMGVLSAVFKSDNAYEWVDNKSGKYWRLSIFDHIYRVFRIGGFRNSIKPMRLECDLDGTEYRQSRTRPSSTPVIDLLKLWSILVDDGDKHSISLKSLIERELHIEAIHYTPEAATTLAYQLQDVERLRDLWSVFLSRVANIEAVRGYTYSQWSNIKTPATFTKIAYEVEYPALKSWQTDNDAENARFGLARALEDAYHGGITIALKRGVSDSTAWFDIHGAYAHTIEYENTDRYLKYEWEPIETAAIELPRDNEPILCHVRTDAVLSSMHKSLKIYRTKALTASWMWSYDILAMRLLFPDACIEIDRAYRLIPGLPDAVSLPITWAAQKEEEERANGKTTRREFFKLLSNTSYGIKAQRQPYRTKHTNMAVAGLITARAHLILAEMINEAQNAGCRWIYSDTDSICVEHDKQDISALESAINSRIAPYSAGCEGYGMRTRTLSLKRYTSVGGQNTDGTTPKSKIRLHGKGQYRINAQKLYEWTEGAQPPKTRLALSSVAGNTERTLKRVIALNPLSAPNAHPFMFETDVRSDISQSEWFAGWYAHIDTKSTYIEGAGVNEEFYREIRTFDTDYHARSFYGSKLEETVDTAFTGDNIDYDLWDEAAYASLP